MVTVTKYEAKTENMVLVECVCDVEADVVDIQKMSGEWIAGSTAFVIETGTVYMRNSSNEWRII